MRIIQVAPTCYGVDGLFGGGERYPLELARALALEVDCELVTFGHSGRTFTEVGGLRVRISELLGPAAIESMASGTPVVASRVGGLAEVVRHSETGFLVQPGDLAGLRDRIATVLADRRLARCLGDNARVLALERVTWQVCAQRCLAA